MTGKINAVTGATGLLGSHLVEALRARGERVRALVRPHRDAGPLEGCGIEVVVGDLRDGGALRRLVDDARIVYHCAAKVGDWGPWEQFRSQTIEATRNLVVACREADVGRLLHVSSVAVYGHPRASDRDFTEDEALGQNLWLWDYYPRAKIAAEKEARALEGQATIVRPSWIYGPRDRSVFPRILQAIRSGRISLVGSGDNLLNMLYVSDVVEGLILAANHPRAAGQVYNLSSEGELTQRQLLDALCDASGLPRVSRRVPRAVAFGAGLLSEAIGRAIRLQRPPYVTRHGVSLLSRPTRFSSRKARDELGWYQKVPASEGLRRTLEWLAEGDHALPAPSLAAEGRSSSSVAELIDEPLQVA